MKLRYMMEWFKSILVYLKQEGIIQYTGQAGILKFCCALTGLSSHNWFEPHRDKICCQS